MSVRLFTLALLVFVFPQNGSAAPAVPNYDLSWEAQAQRACKSGEFEMFLEAFMRSENVQKHRAADIVKVSRQGKTKRVKRQNYGPVPIEMMDYHFILGGSGDAASAPVSLKVETRPYGKGGYRMDWIKETYEESGEGERIGELVRKEGEKGYMILKKSKRWGKRKNDIREEVN